MAAALAASVGLALAGGAAADTPEEILASMEKVADWQLKTMYAPDFVPSTPRTADPIGWVQAVFFIGLGDLADRTRNPAYHQAVAAHGAKYRYALPDRIFHADDHVIGQSWLWLYGRERRPEIIAPTKTRLDYILAHPPTDVTMVFDQMPPGQDGPCRVRWCWSDALFMAPPVWFALSKETGDPRYSAYADSEFWVAADYLYDKEEKLFYRDSRFFTRRDDTGGKIFWSRGNAWVFAAFPRILELLPADHPSRPRYVALYREMAGRLLELQREDGSWPTSLLAGGQGTPESSGTGFFTYGMAWGIKTGLLDAKTFRPAVDRGWRALRAAVKPDGKLGWVQQTGDAPAPVGPEDTQFYGVGAYLMAGSILYDLETAARR
jgi:rhamnogalacturonyl hydrolase YesR